MRYFLLLLVFLCLCAGCTVSETPQPTQVIPEPQVQDTPEPTTTVVVSEPRPINAVLMLSNVGHWWSRVPPEETWTLKFIWCDAKNFLPYPVHLDTAFVEIDGQSEVVPIDVSIEPGEYNREIFIYTTSISGFAPGDYPLHVALLSGGGVICEREDLISLTWKEQPTSASIQEGD